MTNAEKNLSKQGFYLLKQTTIKIDDKDKTDYDMVITFDPSQNCVELWCKNQGTIFVEPPLLTAIQERISELNF